jgi:hypothetical protein
MTKFIQSALAVAVLLTGALSSTANSVERTRGAGAAPSYWSDHSDPYGGFGPNTQEGNRAYWDYQGRHGN